MKNILIFGGTSEGRNLFNHLLNLDKNVHISLATTFGGDLIDHPNMIVGRLDEAGILDLVEKLDIDVVVDTTHPYATIVTDNIKSALATKELKYLRLVRENIDLPNAKTFNDVNSLIDYLETHEGRALLTTGSKDLIHFTRLENFATRLIVRILPVQESLENALNLGYSPKNIICMMGPFTREMNEAMINHYNCDFIVTKDSGKAGNITDKLNLPAEALVITKPRLEEGYSYEEILEILK